MNLVRQQSQEQPRECAHVELFLEKFPFGQFNEEHFIPESNKNKQEVSKGFVCLLVCLVFAWFNYVQYRNKPMFLFHWFVFFFARFNYVKCEIKPIQIVNKTKTLLFCLFVYLFLCGM